MTPEQMRELADRLSDPCSPDDDDLETVADFLHQCAEQRPVGWQLVPMEPTGLMVDAGREAMQRAPDLGGIVSANTAAVMDSYTAMLAAAPAAPQAEPSAALIRAYNSGYMQGHHDTVESCFTDIHQSDMDTFHADLVAELGLSAAPQAEPIDPHMSVADDRFPDEQAEPKRGPLTDERIASVCLSYRHDFGLLSGDEQTGLMLEARAWERAFRKEWQRC